MTGRWILAGLALVVCWSTAVDAKRLTVTASKTELFNTQDADADCSELFNTADADLPFHVVRIRATTDTTPTGPVRWEWSLPKPSVGTFLADQDIPANEQSSVVRSLCAELGNTCTLTAEQLKVYNQPSVLWIAPTCDAALPSKASQPYRGGEVTIAVKATSGKKKLGKGSVSIGYGRTSNVTLRLHGRTGDGNANGIPADLKELFQATVDPKGVAMPQISRYIFANGDGDGTTIVTPAPTAEAALTYATAGKHTATVATVLADGSAVCDNLLANVGSAVNRMKVEVTLTPKRSTYQPGSPSAGTVNFRVRVRNTSDPAVGSAILLQGGSVLTCDTEIKSGKSTLTQSTQIDFQHCSATVGQACSTDADCTTTACPDCDEGETCLTSSHCAETRTDTNDPLGCLRDADCTRFVPGDRCIHVLPIESLLLPIGDASDLVDSIVPLANTLPGTAKVKETWTVRALNAPEDSTSVRYDIRSNPEVKP